MVEISINKRFVEIGSLGISGDITTEEEEIYQHYLKKNCTFYNKLNFN